MGDEDEDDQNETPQIDQPEPLLTGDPDALHVFVVREADLPHFLPPVVDSTLSGMPTPPGPSGPPPSAADAPGIRLERVGTILGALTILILLVGGAALAWSLIVPAPEATVILIPRTWTVSLTRPIQSGPSNPLRVLAPVTVSRSLTGAATGTGHTQARQARGTITLYNGAFETQTVAAGTALTGRDGIVIVTDTAAIIPAARPTTPPTYGQTSVPAHAAIAGSAGNIAAYDVDQACCATSVLAKNLAGFSGGQDARILRVVTQADIDGAARRLAPVVQAAVSAHLQAALHPGEQLARLPCQPHQLADAQAGQAASSVTVTVTATCQAVAYGQAAVQAQALTWLSQLARQRAGQAVQPVGTPRMSVSSVALTGGTATLTLVASGSFMPVFSAQQDSHMAAAIAGKPVTAATGWLLAQPGVQNAQITVSGSTTLPQNPAQIHILVELPTPEPAGSPVP